MENVELSDKVGVGSEVEKSKVFSGGNVESGRVELSDVEDEGLSSVKKGNNDKSKEVCGSGFGKTERTGSFYDVGDLVWGKVKSHPWWPGQVYSEELASVAVRRSKTEGYVLVAFFGDSSYGWFDPSELVPFDSHYAEKSQQTSLRTFVKAVEEAVDEASRRCSLGLACRCRNVYNFRPTTVSGYLSVDVGDFENGSVYCVDQIRKSRDDFRPMEMLDFVNQLALSSVNVEHEAIDFVKNKATALAYRKAVYEEFDETYAQAFGHEPQRPSRGQQDLNQPPKLATPAPLSGPLVIAEVLRKGKGYAKSHKSKDHAKKDPYISERRDEPKDLKTSFGVHQGQASSSEQPVSAEGSLATAALQNKSPFISKKHKVSGKHQRRESSARGEVSNPRQEAGENGGMTTDNKTAGVGVGHAVSSILVDLVADRPFPVNVNDDEARLTTFEPVKSLELSSSQEAKFKLHGEQGQDGCVAHPPGTGDAKSDKEGSFLKSGIQANKVKVLKRPTDELKGKNSTSLMKKRKKELISSKNTKMPPSGGKFEPSVGRTAKSPGHIAISSREDLQVEPDIKKEKMSYEAGKVSQVASIGFDLPQLLHSLQALARSSAGSSGCMPVVRQAFLRYRSLVFEKSLVSSPAADGDLTEIGDSDLPAVTKAFNIHAEGVRERPSSKLQRQMVRPDDSSKGGRKRGPSDRLEEIVAKKKKKISDMKALTSEKKTVQKTPIVQQPDGIKEASGLTMRSLKPAPFKKPETYYSRAPDPVMLVMKFPPQGTLPSIMELKARFARFGQLDHSATRIYWKTLTCRLVYRHRADAESACRFASSSSTLFGNSGVKCYTREVEVAVSVTEPGQAQKEDSSKGTSQSRDLAVEQRPATSLTSHSLQQPGSQPKSILKKSNGDETSGTNGGGKGTRVKFSLVEEETNRGGEQSMIGNKNINNNAVFVDGGASFSTNHGKDFSSKNSVIPPPPLPMLPIPTAAQYPRPPNYSPFAELASRNPHNYNIAVVRPMTPTLPKIDISQQMMGLLHKCNDVVNKLTAYLGYLPLHPL
ncbi:PWWP domain-containing protein [Heracleum sosnowskyi]|uniref:PWWP domain-containing protein n=1 Tax=Heracleum sosnowskyi TaxID=360622 RepID=A0AAD8HPY5_9APIA|nr:PWWP domain-containing protein [Heracleum sosnowskyi]